MIIYSLLLRGAPCQGKTRRADWIELLSEYVVRRGDYQSYSAYLHVVADQAILTNSWAINYVANVVSYVAGLASTLDEKVALTNYTTTGLKQLPGLVYTPGQLDSLTHARINVLRSKGQGKSPALLHDATVATDASDYTQVLRMRIKGLVVATMLAIGDPFIGKSSIDGLQLTSMKTALDNGLSELSKRGYVSSPSVRISNTQADSVIGHASLYLKFHPADQLVQLDAFVGLRPGLFVLPEAKRLAPTRQSRPQSTASFAVPPCCCVLLSAAIWSEPIGPAATARVLRRCPGSPPG
jgi:hypothetical protein